MQFLSNVRLRCGHTPRVDIPTSTPSEQGADPAGIAAFVDALEHDPRLEPHGLIIQRHGHRIAEAYWAPHRAGELRLVYSLSKTFTGTALGLQLGEGRLSLDDLVTEHFPAETADVTDSRTASMRVRHLASMATGHDREMLIDALVADPTDVVGAFFHLPPPQDPGTVFAYNQPPVLALATLLQRLAGERLVDYLRPRVLDPLGIADLRWHQHRPGIDLGFSGVFTDLDAIARLGQLHLDDGVWDGVRLLPPGWVEQASRPQVANPNEPEVDWRQGYGFQLWMCRHGYRGDGAYGQFMVVLPEQDAVLALFSGNEDMQAILDHAWVHLLPALGDQVRSPGPGDEALADHLRGLSLPTATTRVGGTPGTIEPGRFTPAPPRGRSHRTITAVDVASDHVVLHEADDVAITVPLGGGWTDVPDHPISASAALDREGRLVVDLVPRATPHRLELTVDPGSGTFDPRWPSVPLFGGGIDPPLAGMRPPP